MAITCWLAAAYLPAPLGGAHVVVDGHELLQGRWGRIELPLPAGHHQVLIYLRRGRRRSRVAQCAIHVPAHHLVELEYRLAAGWFGGAGLAQPPDT
ncbi:hypothetical protein [Gordonia aquimaris]|uniref:Uncharacterized protein n=1 Tax=Gordonia aquimaris TaxID=2984863 RepID=A0A9X3D4P0_9ACTN|nr:hypothetical protein [Gordonia aquimaris]MCX2964899.1 hypothetical protein [Gordonia aquimaris]